MVPFSAIIFKNPALQAVWFYYASTPGYKPGDMKISPFRTFSQIDLKSLPITIGIHNRMVIDLRKTTSKKATACKAGQDNEEK